MSKTSFVQKILVQFINLFELRNVNSPKVIVKIN